MSYQICDLGHLPELAEVRTYFGLTLDSDWLNAVQIVVSPDNAVIVLVHGEKMGIFVASNSKTLQAETTPYLLQWLGTLANPNEIITSVLCLPSHIIVIGLDTGAVHFYDENGLKLYSQRFSPEPVISIKSHFPSTWNGNDNFLMYIFYANSLVMLKSIDFLDKILEIKKSGANQYLQTNQLEYYYHYEFPSSYEMEDKCKNKLLYSDINDVIVIPHQVSTICDLITEKSPCQNIGDFEASYQQYNLVISVGSKYFLAFHKATETKRKILQSEKDSRIKLQMDTLCQIYDHRREGRKIYVSPNGLWAAIVDNLERILLVDILKKIIVRVWKGYPEAQCGFLYVPENPTIHTIPTESYPRKTATVSKRGAMFLEIYVPSLGCLEIWSLLHGNKVARFNLCKSGQLIYKTPKPIGMDCKTQALGERSCCFFMDPNDGNIKAVDIPFHYALDTVNGEISADMQNLRCLKRHLEKYSVNYDSAELLSIEKLSTDFQTMVGREQCMILLVNEERLHHTIYTTILNALHQKVTRDLNELLENSVLDDALMKKRESLLLEISIYNKYKELDDFVIDLQQMIRERRRRSLLKLQLANSDYESLNQWIKDLNLIKELQENELQLFHTTQSTHLDSKDENCDKIYQDFLGLVLKFSINFYFAPLNDRCMQAYKDFFSLLFQRHCQTESGLIIFRSALKQMKDLNSINIINFLFNFWLDEKCIYKNIDDAIIDMSMLSAQLRLICEIMEPENSYDNYNDIIIFWQETREMLLNYTQPITLPMVVTCKTLALELIHNQMKKDVLPVSIQKENATNAENEDDVSSLDENWENISQEETQWLLLISKLEPTLILSAVLRDTSNDQSTSQMPSFSSSHELDNCSLKTILTGGKGIVTDLTAQWLICKQLHPIELRKLRNNNETTNIDVNNKPKNRVLELILLLRRYFPYSLDLRLILCLMAWHYMIYWSKHLEHLEYFEAAMDCLKHLEAEDAVLKQKLGCLLWRAAIKIPFHLISKLIHKIGHLPTEKLCQQELGMSAVAITRFLELSLEFLLELNQTVMQCREDNKRIECIVQYEDILIDGPEPIQSLIIKQQPVIETLLELQTELCYVLHFITFFQLKYTKLLTKLFDNARYTAFFMDINIEESNNQTTSKGNHHLQQAHLDLQTTRRNFLCRTVSAAIDLIRINVDGTVFTKEYIKYTRRVLSLTNLWVLDLQAILRQQVIDLYAHDYDSLAESILVKCEGDPNISPKLLEIAGLRLNLYVNESSYRFRLMAKGPKLLQHQDYLANRPDNNDNIQITCNESQDVNLEKLKNLVMNAMKFMEFTDPKNKHLVGVANEMYHVCMEFIELDKLKLTTMNNIRS